MIWQVQYSISGSWRTACTFVSKVQNYNDALQTAVEKHAPLKKKIIKIVPHSPWFDEEYAVLRKSRRKAEKIFRRTGLEKDKKTFVSLRRQTTALSRTKKKTFIDEELKSGGSKTLFT